jgi:hypothetical protein
MYAYLLRHARQGLLKRASPDWGCLFFAHALRGHARLEYFSTESR